MESCEVIKGRSFRERMSAMPTRPNGRKGRANAVSCPGIVRPGELVGAAGCGDAPEVPPRPRSAGSEGRDGSQRHDGAGLGGEHGVDGDEGVRLQLRHGDVLRIERRLPALLPGDLPRRAA